MQKYYISQVEPVWPPCHKDATFGTAVLTAEHRARVSLQPAVIYEAVAIVEMTPGGFKMTPIKKGEL